MTRDERGAAAPFFIVAAVVVFALLALLVLVDDTPDAKLNSILLAAGLASFAAGHLPV